MIKSVGTKTKINIAVNRILHKKYEYLGIDFCEIGRYFNYLGKYANCKKKWEGYAHDKKRREYENPADMATVKHTLRACNNCHDIIEPRRILTAYIFSKLRGKTVIEPEVKTQAKTKQKLSSKKPDWFRPHKCKGCGKIVTGTWHAACGNMSV